MLLNFKYNESNILGKGKPNRCKHCNFKFKFPNMDEKLKWGKSRYICPKCNINYCILPPTERDLRIIQDDYFTSKRNEKYLKKMYDILKKYSKSLILKRFSNLIFSPDNLEYYSHCSSVYFLEYYLKNDSFKVEDSFAGLLLWKIKQAIWRKEEHLVDDVSINFLNDENKHVFEIPNQCNEITTIENNSTNITIRNNLILIINSNKFKHNPKNNLKRLIALNLFLNKKTKKNSNKFFKLTDNTGIVEFKNTLEDIKYSLNAK